MWTEFLIAAIVGLAAIYLPGMLIARALRRSVADCFVYAPLISIAVYSCMGIVYAWAGIPCNWPTTFLVLLVVGLICWIINLTVQKRAQNNLTETTAYSKRVTFFIRHNSDWRYLAGYIAVGLCATGFMFLHSLNGADAFSSELDNAFHYGTIRSFAETGNWSSLDSGFYPSAWHVVGALIYSIFPVEITLISNVENTLFIAFVFSSGMFAWLRRIFPNCNTAVLFGMFCSFLIDPLPWYPLVYGPIIPFMAGICLLPSVMASFMDLLKYETSFSCKARLSIIFALALIATALMQPSGIFALMLFALPYCWTWVLACPKIGKTILSTSKKIWLIAGLTVLWLAIWFGFYFAPFMQSVIDFPWVGGDTLAGALSQVVSMTIFAWIGIVVCIATKRHRWIIVPFIYMVVAYVTCSCSNGLLDRLLTGFWYTDPIRIIAMTALFAVPLICCALAFIKDILTKFLKRHIASLKSHKAFSAAANVLITLLLVGLTAITVEIDSEGKIHIGHTLGRGGIIWEYNSIEDHQYTRSKSAFMREAAEIINEERVLNNPTDGSMFCWGIDGIDVVYANLSERQPNAKNSVIASRISDIATDPEVQAAVEATGAKYLLQLDTPEAIDEISNHPNSEFLPYWADFYSIDENTPGLELVLKDGNMKLYRILPFAPHP